MILGIDTSSALTSVAVVEGEVTVASAEHDDPRQHGEVLAGMVKEVMTRARHPRISEIACGVGPGPYTGLRVGIATSTALGLAWQIPVYGVCSLDALASRLAPQLCEPFVVASDARRREVYWARFDRLGLRLEGPYVGAPGELPQEIRRGPWMGEGGSVASEFVAWTGDASRAHAIDVARLVRRLLLDNEVQGPVVRALSAHGTDDGSTADQLAGSRLLPPTPLYVRRPDAMVS